MTTDQTMCSDAFDQHGKYFAGITLPIAAVQENQARCRFVGGRIKIDLHSSRSPYGTSRWHLRLARKLAEASLRSAISTALFFYRRIIIIGRVAFGLRKGGPVQSGIERDGTSSHDVIHTKFSCNDISAFLVQAASQYIRAAWPSNRKDQCALYLTQ